MNNFASCAAALLALTASLGVSAQELLCGRNHYILDIGDTPSMASGTDVSIGLPGAVATDACGNVYFSSPNVVLKLDAQGTITRVAGGQTAGYSGDDGPAAAALLDIPYDSYPELAQDPIDFDPLVGGLAVDASGNLYIADAYNDRVRKVTPAGIITTVGRNGSVPWLPSWPQGVVADAEGGLYVTSAGGALSRIAPDGVVSTVIGNNCGPGYLGPGLCAPEGIALDSRGNLYVADGYCRVRRIGPDGSVVTVAGVDTFGFGFSFTCGHSIQWGTATSTALAWPYGVAIDASGHLLIADTYNHCIRRVDADGNIATVIGACGVPGFSGDGGPATQATLHNPSGVAVDATGTVFIADTLNGRIRQVSPDGVITTVAGNGGKIPDEIPAAPTLRTPEFREASPDGVRRRLPRQ